MPVPALLAVDAEPELASVERELRGRYEGSYRVICTAAPDEALATLTELSDAGEEVALVLAAHSLSEPGGDVLERAHQLHPHARRGLLVGWGEWGDVTTAKAIFDLMALGRIDYFLLRPAVSPDELFHHAISGFLLEWTEARRIAPHTVRIVGDAWAGRAHELRQTLQRCAIPHAFYLTDSPDGRSALAKAGAEAEPPCVILPDGKVLNDPTNREIADATGASIDHEGKDYDVAILGAGPAGLSAAVYSASEGLDTLVADEGGIGGQATSSSLIRNYLGFPRGISGRRLGQQAYEQAWVFGARFSFMHRATDIGRVGDRLVVTLTGDRRVFARAVILAMGAEYRRLDVPALESLHGAGVFSAGPLRRLPRWPARMPTWSGAPTQRARRRCTWPTSPAGSRWWCEPIPECPHVALPRAGIGGRAER